MTNSISGREISVQAHPDELMTWLSKLSPEAQETKDKREDARSRGGDPVDITAEVLRGHPPESVTTVYEMTDGHTKYICFGSRTRSHVLTNTTLPS